MKVKTVKKIEEYDDVLTVEEVREILKIGRNSVYKMLKNNTIKNIRIGSNIRIPKQFLIDFLQSA